MNLNGLSWIDTVISGTQAARIRLREKILEGLKYFNAVYKGSKVKFDPKAKEIYDFVTSDELIEVGFVPIIDYIKVKGVKDDLNVYWRHENGIPSLLYKHKRLPMLIIVSPTLEFNKSHLSNIDANKKYRIELDGISS